jgi:Putative Flp pilus-assembly TadE/G-like
MVHSSNLFFECLAGWVGGELEGNEMNKIFNRIKDESGQALVIVAVSLVALLGVTAFSVDLGMAYNAKAELQAAADAAALAGAQDLPNATLAMASAKSYAGFNEVTIDNVQVVTPYAGDSKLIEVTCTRTFDYLFAKVLGFDSKVIVARAVATREAKWVGDALPFMNLDDDYTVNPNITLWEKTTAAGDDEKLWPYDQNKIDAEYEITVNAGLYDCTLVDMEDGFALKSGIVKADQDEITGVVDQSVGSYVYVLSLRGGTGGPIDPNENYGNKEVISTHDVVLLKCYVEGYNIGVGVSNDLFGIHLTWDGVTVYEFDDVLDGDADVPDITGTGVPIIKLVE